MRGLLPEAALRSMEEQLSGSCTVEIAAFDEFSGLIGNPEAAKDYDHVIFDTAPTGHTLRLMSLAKAWDQFLDKNTSGTSCLGPLAGLEKQRVIYEATVNTLADAKATTLVLVSRPQGAALREAERTSKELRAIGVGNQCFVVNGTFETQCPEDVTAQAMQQRGLAALKASAAFISSMPSFIVPLRPINILGINGLRVLLEGEALWTAAACCRFPEPALLASRSQDVTNSDSDVFSPAAGLPQSKADAISPLESLADLVTDIEQQGHGVIMTMGKGGVGKTTVAAAIAVMLARRGHSVHLSTTDPAAHVAQTLHGKVEGLTLSKIDPAAETAVYQGEVMLAQGAAMDEAGRALLEEDLRSPCTEEIAVFRAFAREVGRGTGRFVVLDTAPTGHTLLLLDASEAYQRELERQARSTQPEEVLKLLERLRDPDFTRILLVTLPEATPVHEAAALQEDLRRARIEPFAWVINQSLLNSGSCDPLLQRREASEQRYLREVVEKQAKRTAWLPWQAEEPVGPEALAKLASSALAVQGNEMKRAHA
jgi:arsenite-transporting ATPase